MWMFSPVVSAISHKFSKAQLRGWHDAEKPLSRSSSCSELSPGAAGARSGGSRGSSAMGNGAAAPLSSRPCRETGPAERSRAALASFIHRAAPRPAVLAVPKLRHRRDFSSSSEFGSAERPPRDGICVKYWPWDTRARADGPWAAWARKTKGCAWQLLRAAPAERGRRAKGRGERIAIAGIQLEAWVLSWDLKILRWGLK